MYGLGRRGNDKLWALLRVLKGDGVTVRHSWSGSPANASEYIWTAEFDDGRMFVRTGDYWFDSRGA